MGKKTLTLKLDWGKAKSLQWAIAFSKLHIKKGTQTLKELEEIEEKLEEFTQSASLVLSGSLRRDVILNE